MRLLALFLSTLVVESRAWGLETIPVERIRRGMVGYGLTVLQGQRPEKFRVRVLGVLHNAFPKQDLILILCDDPKLKHFGVAAGMSGSPIFFQGKLAGALAYGPSFSRDPIAMVTPIRNMLAELQRPLHGLGSLPGRLPPGQTPFRMALAELNRRVANILSGRVERRAEPFGGRWGMGLAGRWEGAVRPLAVPLSVSGLDPEGISELRRLLGGPEWFLPVQGGAGGKSAVARYGRVDRFVPGGSIGVQIVRGDMSATATGTVTAVVGNRLVAFGHPFWGLGEMYLPAVGAWIHTIVSSYAASFKMSTPLNELGSLIQDRRPCIAVESGRKAPMIPMTTEVVSGGRTRTYRVDVLSHPALSPKFVYLVLRAALRNAASDATESFAKVSVRLETDKLGTVGFTDYFANRTGAYMGLWPSVSRGLVFLNLLYSNEFQPVEVRRVTARVEVAHGLRAAAVERISLSSPEVRPGERLNLRVALRVWRKGIRRVTVPIRIPEVPAGTLLRIRVQGGASVTPDAASPQRLQDVLRIFRKMYDSTQLVVSLRSPSRVVSVRGRLVENLPGSVADSLVRAASAEDRTVLSEAWRRAVGVGMVVLGSKDLYVRVVEDRE